MTIDGLEGALQQDAHIVEGKKVTCKKAKAKTGRIYPGGLTEDISDFDIHEGLSKVIAVKDISIPESKSYAFVRLQKKAMARDMIHAGKISIIDKISKVQSKAKPPSTSVDNSSVAKKSGQAHGCDQKSVVMEGKVTVVVECKTETATEDAEERLQTQ